MRIVCHCLPAYGLFDRCLISGHLRTFRRPGGPAASALVGPVDTWVSGGTLCLAHHVQEVGCLVDEEP